MSTPFMSVILPIYNEEKRLAICLAHLTDYFWNYTKYGFEILCVLNGCTDGSEKIANQFAKKWPHHIQVLYSDPGKGAAVSKGMLAASGEFRYMADVDLATPITELPKFIDALVGNRPWNIPPSDVAVGLRIMRYTSLTRCLAHWAYKKLAGSLTCASDPQSGFKMFRAMAAENVFINVTTKGWGFDVEALHLAESMGYRVRDVSVRWKHCPGSKLDPIKDGFQMARDLVRIRRARGREALQVVDPR